MKRKLYRMVFPVFFSIMLVVFTSACNSETPVPEDNQSPTNTTDVGITIPEKTYVAAASDEDGWRDYSFASNTIEQWVDSEGNQVINVWVRIDYNNNPGAAVRDVQHWRIDYQNNRYKVSDDFSYDAEGRSLDLCYHNFEEVSWRDPVEGTTIVHVLAAIQDYMESK